MADESVEAKETARRRGKRISERGSQIDDEIVDEDGCSRCNKKLNDIEEKLEKALS